MKDLLLEVRYLFLFIRMQDLPLWPSFALKRPLPREYCPSPTSVLCRGRGLRAGAALPSRSRTHPSVRLWLPQLVYFLATRFRATGALPQREMLRVLSAIYCLCCRTLERGQG